MKQKTVLVSGAGGFVAGAVIPSLIRAGWQVRAASRSPQTIRTSPGLTAVAAPDLGPDADWAPLLHDCDVVIHLAARVHVLHETAADPEADFQRVNAHGTATLARQAADCGVRRLVLASSIKVNGETTPQDHPFTANDPMAPQDPYARSKADAERALWAVCSEGTLQGVVVRPPLVYGPGAKGNFATLLSAVRRHLPLPLACIGNRRSLISRHNLASALTLCADHPAAPGQTFLVSDGEDLSTADLIRQMAQALSTHAVMLPVPDPLLRILLTCSGQRRLIPRLLDSLTVDAMPIRHRCGWQPPQTVDDGIRQACVAAQGKTIPVA